METYTNLSGQSNIARYEIGGDYITVEFASGPTRFYKYTYAKPGANHVERMKELARDGQGLNSYINTNPEVRNGYESKW